MADDLTVTIAFTLSQHRQVVPQARPDGWEHCSCGWRGVALATHQAEAVRAALGETATEWAVDEIDHEWRTVSSPEKAETLMPGRPLYRRTVTPWVEVPRG